MNKLATRVVCFFLLLVSFAGQGQIVKDSIRSRYFRQRDFAKYFVSDIYAPTPQIQGGMGWSQNEYNIATSRHAEYLPYNQTDFGAEMPIFTKVKYSDNKLVSKFSISIPIAARIWFDFTEPSTSPILNTDFQYAPLEFNYLKTTHRKLIHNIAIKLCPFFHESSHLGDEITLYRRMDTLPVTWVNVSHETSEIALTLNDANGKLTNNTAWKLGIKLLLNPRHGWYSVRNESGDSSVYIATKRLLETYVQVQNQANMGWLANDKFIRVMSVEVRERVQYGYPTYPSPAETNWKAFGDKERINLCMNAYLGWKFNFSNNLIPRFGAYLKGYYGINPYGQFRNLNGYRYLGISLVYEN